MEGFDEFGNKTFKDEYKLGLRTKHKPSINHLNGAQGGTRTPTPFGTRSLV